ncbi:MAG TPA: nuclear transport factor 2 family protein [Nakamurella sp.]
MMNRSAAIEDLVTRWFAAASSGDATLVDSAVSGDEGVCLIGSDPDEWFTGGGPVAEFLRGEVTNAGGRARFTAQDVVAFEDGGLGWARAKLTITLPDGSHINPRWTAVFRREEGATWRFVHIHASIGVPNDAAGWIYPEG